MVQVYITRINEVARINGRSLEVSYVHLASTHPVFGLWLADAPKQMLDIFHS